jgi:nickel-dependent lactate racemase
LEAAEETPVEPEQVPETVSVVSEQAAVAETAPPVRPRFGDRNIDLPIDVPESERQYHNAARRFARLLVSEIKLYNEQKVQEGCEAGDLYERLKEAIDRSREMYEKRVHGPVAETFDYFDYELVNNLAQGDKSKLGGSYPGSTV